MEKKGRKRGKEALPLLVRFSLTCSSLQSRSESAEHPMTFSVDNRSFLVTGTSSSKLRGENEDESAIFWARNAKKREGETRVYRCRDKNVRRRKAFVSAATTPASRLKTRKEGKGRESNSRDGVSSTFSTTLSTTPPFASFPVKTAFFRQKLFKTSAPLLRKASTGLGLTGSKSRWHSYFEDVPQSQGKYCSRGKITVFW